MPIMRTFVVFLSRVDSKAGPRANFSVELQAPDQQMAKRTAEAQYPGYEARNVRPA